MLGGPYRAPPAYLTGGMYRAGARWWFERLHGLAPEELGVDHGGSVGRTTLWKCYHMRRHDTPAPVAAGAGEDNVLWL